MAKPRKTLRIELRPHSPQRLEWRRQLLNDAIEAAKAQGVRYDPTDELELTVRRYLPKATIQDVDNCLKDIMDALQGRCGGSKAIQPETQIIKNDRQVWCVTIEKGFPPKQNLAGGGLLTIRRYRASWAAWKRGGGRSVSP